MATATTRRYRAREVFWLLSLPLAMIGGGGLLLWDFGDKLPLFDAQGHYDREVWRRAPPSAVLHTLEELNVVGVAVSSSGNEGVEQLRDFGTGLVVPMLSLYENRAERDSWFEDQRVLDRLAIGLRRTDYVGIGEVHLYDGQVRGPVVEHLVERAVARDLVLNAHADAAAIEQLYALNPGLRVLWAHAGMTTSAETVSRMLDRYPNLVAELSHRLDVAPDGELKAEWRAVFLRHPDRFMIGSGTYTNEYWYQFRYTMEAYRDWLAQLPRAVAEKIAYRNALRIFRRQLELAG